jgi:hypothetical protein
MPTGRKPDVYKDQDGGIGEVVWPQVLIAVSEMLLPAVCLGLLFRSPLCSELLNKKASECMEDTLGLSAIKWVLLYIVYCSHVIF